MLKEKISYKDGLPVNVMVANIKEYPIHFHNDIEVVYVLNGSIGLRNGYYTYTLKQGDVFILNDKEIHSYENTGEDNMVLIVQLDVQYFSDYYDNLANSFFVTDENDKSYESLEVLKHILARITMEKLQQKWNFKAKVIENAHSLITCLISDFQYYAMEDGKFINESEKKLNKTLAERLRRITAHMYENYEQKLMLSELAKNEHLSVFHLSRVIKQSTGLTFQDLLNFIRVEESEKLLLGTNKKIGTISHESGFSAVRYYIKHFERWFGMHPLEYRQKYTGKVISRKIVADFKEYDGAVIEEALKNQVNPIGDEYGNEKKPEIKIVEVNLPDCMQDNKRKLKFEQSAFEREIFDPSTRQNPFSIFRSLNERIIFISDRLVVSTPAKTDTEVRSLSILVYNFDEEIEDYDDEIEIFIRCIGISGKFEVVRYHLDKENIMNIYEETVKNQRSKSKKQELVISLKCMPSVKASEVRFSETQNLSCKFKGVGVELLLLNRQQ